MAQFVARDVTRPGWWVSGLVLAAAGWWGQPLIAPDHFERAFFGLFWYTMLALAVVFWALPSERRFTGSAFVRRIMLLGVIPVYTRSQPVSAFRQIVLETDPNVVGPDTLWVLAEGDGGSRFAFMHRRATRGGRARQLGLAKALAEASGLPFAGEVLDAG
ncbi:hypothetical protein [Jeongeupia chitinilytica]|uniref:PH domain-containing protein n=1 Tax=Jeongeupia chitinilytica TaxID=1041641 RepID=A0ABQ3H4N5_9NEIS|nr:hypothetical protein [Jeongeupia chitinilytica]GHD64763.1 hypothetical protein GCM10007350_24460 [Jeongeupia chitinilytica]